MKMGVHNSVCATQSCSLVSLVFIRLEVGKGVLKGYSSKNRPKTKVVELVKGYKKCQGQFFNPGLRWPAKRKILSETRLF